MSSSDHAGMRTHTVDRRRTLKSADFDIEYLINLKMKLNVHTVA